MATVRTNGAQRFTVRGRGQAAGGGGWRMRERQPPLPSASIAMDPIDGFYQALDSEQLLLRHGPELRQDAREILAQHPRIRVAGRITLPDASDAEAVRRMLAAGSGQDVPPGGLMIGVVPRESVEALLAARCSEFPWREESWQPQQVLPVVVSTKDGFRFGFFALGENDGQTTGS
jgi:hypothetical protein